MNDSTAELPIVVTLHCAFKLGGDSEDKEVPEDRFIEAAIGAACKRFLGEMGAKRIDWTLDEVTATPDSAAGDFTVRVKVKEARRRRRAKSRSNRQYLWIRRKLDCLNATFGGSLGIRPIAHLRPHQMLWASLTALRSMASRRCRVCVTRIEEDFIALAVGAGCLKFGEFTLKSGRVSPYFFNAGGFSTGGQLLELAEAYADAIVAEGIQFDVIFGPAYK
ncbi:hypothetical protein FOZ60_007272, partial [Perkinsus olseni]